MRASGVLPVQHLKRLWQSGAIGAVHELLPNQFQPCSLDLRLGSWIARTECSFLPARSGARELLDKLTIDQWSLRELRLLEPGRTYIAPLQEQLDLPSDVSGQVNSKSTAGRLDLLTRLITETGRAFDTVPPGYRGPLYQEIVPLSFPIKVRAGDSLSQMRLLKGHDFVLSDREVSAVQEKSPFVLGCDGEPVPPHVLMLEHGVFLSVRLMSCGTKGPVGYHAKRTTPAVVYSSRGHNVDSFWLPIAGLKNDDDSLILRPDDFSILSSLERLAIPASLCAEIIPFDPKSGEFRTHYAGFVDSGFGLSGQGAHVVLEVRNRDIPFAIQHAQRLFRMVLLHNLEEPEALYGAESGSAYEGQIIKLAKQFGGH